jgi:glycosyltransferase involved in cell wall biosynthesis
MTQNARVAIFIPTLAGGGAETSMLTLAKGLAERGYQVDLLLKQKKGELVDAVSESVRIMDFNVPTMRYTLPKIIAYRREYQPKAIISALELPNMINILSKMAVKGTTRTIISMRGMISHQKPVYHKNFDRFLQSHLYPQADTIVCVSHANARDAMHYLGLSASKVKVIYNPVINNQQLYHADISASFDWMSDPHKKIILAIGRLEAVKDHKTLLKAFHLVRKTCPAKLVILGEGSLRNELLQTAVTLGISEEVILPGFIPRPLSIISRSDVLVMSSLYEGFGNVIIEALANGCPVVSTAIGGSSEILNEGKYGHLIPVGDHQAMAQAILKVLNGDRRLAPPEWLSQFEVDKNIDQYVKLIET